MEKESSSKGKEVLFLPPPLPAVANVETQFKDKGLRFSWVEGHQELFDRLNATPPFLLVFDLSRWDGSIMNVLSQIEGHLGDSKAIIFGNDGELKTLAVEPLKEIAFFQDALDASALSTALKRILGDDWGLFKKTCGLKRRYHLLFCHSKKMEKVKAIVDQVAPTDITLLIEGESGTGKELVAQAVHFKSLRHTKPLIKVNCAAIPGQLLESELFGFEKGAFTGAHAWKPGKFELAHEGTIFLDEIGNLDSSLQAKLLEVLQDKEFSRLGGKHNIAVDTRFIACTKSDLRDAVAAGRFREDLFYRLNVVTISLPPLRERKEEIPSLIQYFLSLHNLRYGKAYPGLSRKTNKIFMSYDWPGNVRQLQNTIKKIVVLEDEEPVVREIVERPRATVDSGAAVSPPSQLLEEGAGNLKDVGRRAAKKAERAIIQTMLTQTRWNRRKTSKLLQISYKALLYKIREYGLDQ